MYDYMPQGYEDERLGTANSYSPYTHNNPQHITTEALAGLTLADYGLTPDALKSYMFGLNILNPATGVPMADAFYEDMIKKALAQVEKKLDIAIFPRIREEHHDYYSAEYNSYVYTHMQKRPILQVEELHLEYNGRKMYGYDPRWWKVYSLPGHIEVSPTPLMQAGVGYDLGSVAGGLFPVMSMPLAMGSRNNFAPQMLHVRYVAGLLPRHNDFFNEDWEMPSDLEKLILKVAMKDVFEQWGRLLVKPGVQSTSLTVDGVTETINTTQTALYTASTAEIAQLNQDIEDLVNGLLGYFGGTFIAL